MVNTQVKLDIYNSFGKDTWRLTVKMTIIIMHLSSNKCNVLKIYILLSSWWFRSGYNMYIKLTKWRKSANVTVFERWRWGNTVGKWCSLSHLCGDNGASSKKKHLKKTSFLNCTNNFQQSLLECKELSKSLFRLRLPGLSCSLHYYFITISIEGWWWRLTEQKSTGTSTLVGIRLRVSANMLLKTFSWKYFRDSADHQQYN